MPQPVARAWGLIPALVPMILSAQELASPASMVSPFEGVCASCHDNTSDESRAPSREALRQMTPERVLAALTTGSMAVFAEDLSDPERRAMAELASGKPFGGTRNRTAAAMSNRCTEALVLRAPFQGPRWNGWDPDPTKGHRFQPLESGGVTAADLGRLRLKWAFAIPDAASASQAQPTIVGGALFIGSDNNFVYALDADTGCVHWSYEANGQVRTAITVGEVTGLAGARYAAYFGDYMGYVTAVDAETGEELWTVKPDDHPAAKITAPPVLDLSPGGYLYVGVSSWEQIPARRLEYECCKFQGSVSAIDVNTGRIVWSTYTMPERPRPLRRNSAGKQLYGPSGAAVWNTPVLDLEQRRLYVGAGTCYISEFFETRVGYDSGTCISVMAFDMDTGERLWWTQLVPMDRHPGGCGQTQEEMRVNCPGFVGDPDDDPSGSPVLHTLSNGRRILIQGQESGRVTALDPDNEGEIVWVAQAGDVLGSSNGGFGGAFDGEYYFKPLPYSGEGSGSMSALRASDGSRAWFTPVPRRSDCEEPESRTTCHSGNWAAATAIPGAVFTGSHDGIMRAYAADTGEVIWEYRTLREFETVNGIPGFGGGFGGAGPSVVDGMIYFGSGYAILGAAPGNVILAFELE